MKQSVFYFFISVIFVPLGLPEILLLDVAIGTPANSISFFAISPLGIRIPTVFVLDVNISGIISGAVVMGILLTFFH